jgi:nucleoside-diphosphate-sugar epimerase
VRIGIVGASGFVGRRLLADAVKAGFDPIGINRRAGPPAAAEIRVVAPDAGDVELRSAIEGCAALVYLAARVHRREQRAGEVPDDYLRVNRDLALRWARSAAVAGVGRFVYVSSVKAVAETSALPLDESTPPRPEDAYGRSKLAAESDLLRGEGLEGLERIIVRPPLVYGPEVGANFLQLLRLAARRLPLPLAGAIAPRTMISVQNLADALLACARAPSGVPARLYFVGDARDLSVVEVIAELRRQLGRPPGLFRMPRSVLQALAVAAGRRAELVRLFEPLQIDSSRIRRELGWSPPQSTADGLAGACRWFLQQSPPA